VKRRVFLGGAPVALALAACEGRAQPTPRPPAPDLRSVAPFPVGAAVRSDRFDDPGYVAALRRHFSQVTADWEMKMEIVLQKDGTFDFSRPDRIAAFAAENRLRLFGHTLVWHQQRPSAFERIAGDRRAFASAYRNYIQAVAGRYAGQAVGWDVVNEPLSWNGEEATGGIWAEVLGPDYIAAAFEHARQAAPDAVLFLNDYNLELMPQKRTRFLRLAEDLLKRGVPLGGLGTQTHLRAGHDPRSIAPAMRDLGSLGLPVHVSELDVSFGSGGGEPSKLLEQQARLFGAVAEAFEALPARQRFALTTWGVRDQDSWRRNPSEVKAGVLDRPLLLDDAGEPKPAFWSAVDAWR
jgi:endo-1,4-beta-xylanase